MERAHPCTAMPHRPKSGMPSYLCDAEPSEIWTPDLRATRGPTEGCNTHKQAGEAHLKPLGAAQRAEHVDAVHVRVLHVLQPVAVGGEQHDVAVRDNLGGCVTGQGRVQERADEEGGNVVGLGALDKQRVALSYWPALAASASQQWSQIY